MKSIKNLFFSLLVVFTVTSIITSCSKDDEIDKNVSKNVKVLTYLKTFYKKDFKLGKSIDTKIPKTSSDLAKSTEIENLIVTEVFVGEDLKARGYVISNKFTNEFLYFIDVDRIDFKLMSVKIDLNEIIVINDINSDIEKYNSTNEFDFIKIAEEFNSGAVQSGKFWGFGSWHYSDCIGGVRNAIRVYHALWFSVAAQYAYDVPCDIDLNNL